MNEKDMKRENGFKSILKGTSIFGGVQVFNILISAIRLKFVAVILGPAGMGIAGLFNSVSLAIQQFTSLGLNIAVVKEIGAAKEDHSNLKEILTALRPLVLGLALIGSMICLLIPGVLSEITFGSQRYRDSFLLLSAAVFFSILGSALMSVLQGLHVVGRLSTASVVGSSVGLLIGVPLYWLFGTDGIVPAMVVLSLSTCIWYFISLKNSLAVAPGSWNKDLHLPIIKRVIVMGLLLMSNDLFKSLVNYSVNIFVRIHGGDTEVGFYQSCNTMTSQYSAIVFTAMAMDYLPRLASAASDDVRMCDVVNRQIEVVGLLIAPVVCAVIFLAPWVIELLQTSEFLVAGPLLRLLALAVVLRALMYPLGYIVFAKDNRRLFFWMESVGANLLTLSLTFGGYYLWGLYGLGVAAIADCSVCLAIYVVVNKKLYGYRPSSKAIRISLLSILSAAGMTAICFQTTGIKSTVASILLLTVVSGVCLHRLYRLWKIS